MEVGTIQNDLADRAKELAERLCLYNREDQIAQLLEAFEKACKGSVEVLLLPGPSGVGKTSLANAIRIPAKESNCLVLEGKFNQFDLDVPYVALRQVLQQLCRTILAASTLEQATWSDRLREAVHDHGALLTHLVPEFTPLLGKQPPLEPIGPLEARHRFAAMIQSVLRVVCRPENPLVLFIDDCQWADPASVHLLRSLALGTDSHFLFLIAAYRDEEVDSEHPFLSLVREWERQSISVGTCQMTGLSFEGIRKMIESKGISTSCTEDSLSQAIHSKSKGNALFASRLVQHVSELSFQRKCEGSIGTIPEVPAELPADILDIFTLQIRRLGEDFQNLLATASCLGHCFELGALASCLEITDLDCERLLGKGIPELIVPFERHRSLHSQTSESNGWFRFRHDRVQQAAKGFIPAERLPEIRLQLVNRLLQKYTERERLEFACDLAEHINAGAHLLRDEEKVFRCVALNLAAAESAMTATAYRSALRYHRAARKCLVASGHKETFWKKKHEFAFKLYLAHAETEYLEGDILEAERCVQVAVERARSPQEKADAMIVSIVHYTLRGLYQEAIAVGRQALQELGVSLPDDSDRVSRDRAIASIANQLVNLRFDPGASLSQHRDPLLVSTTQVFIAMGPPCYRSRQSLWGWIVPMVVQTILQQGSMPELGYSFPAMTGLLMYSGHDPEDARRFMKYTGDWIANANPSYSDRSVAYLMLGSSARHWFEPLTSCSDDYRKAVEMGKQSGNLQYATYALAHDMYCNFFSGRPLQAIFRDGEVALGFCRTRQNRWAIDLLEGGMRVVDYLCASSRETPNDAQFLGQLESHGNRQVAVIYHIMQAQANLFLGDFTTAWEHSERAHQDLDSVATQGLLPWPEHLYTRLLLQIIRENMQPSGSNLPSSVNDEVTALLSRLSKWAEQAPENYRHKQLLAQAELARLAQDYPTAASLFDQAIDEARRAGFHQWESFANERAAEFWRSLDNSVLVAIYWRYAFQSYQRWGAQSKLHSMAESFRTLIGSSLERPSSARTAPCVETEDKCREIMDRQTFLLSRETKQFEEQYLSEKTTRVVEELTSAAHTLRRDLAANREAAQLLQEQRDRERAYNEELEQRVKHRTRELEIVAKKLEASNQVLERRNEELDHFAYIASHDLKAPLHGIGLVSAWLREDCGNLLPVDSLRYLDELDQRVHRMGNLLDSILAYSRAGRTLGGGEVVRVKDLIDQILDSLNPPECFRIHVQLPMPVLKADPNGMQQVFQNLIQNAIKHHHRKDGTITLSWRDVGSFYEFSVADDGPGIDPRYHSKIFEMFQTLRPRDQVEGCGIGLSITKRVIELHGGQIAIESEVDRGTVFRFTWPKQHE